MPSDAPIGSQEQSVDPTLMDATEHKPLIIEGIEAIDGGPEESPAKPNAEEPASSKPPAKKPVAKKRATGVTSKWKKVRAAREAQGVESDETAIKFDHVTKTYKLYKNERSRFLSIFGNANRHIVGTVNANDDLSFEVKKGEAVMLVGRNGAGKSTALKMITGVTYPTSGTVTVNGRVSALLELNAGFDGQLTGRENLELRSQIMGMQKEEFKALEEEIVDFAELGVYIDQPMKMYSSGMKARLGFALAVTMNPDILVIDEALSVGDRAFKNKCIERMAQIMSDKNVTIMFVTHQSKTAKEFCTRGIVLDHGKGLFDGSVADALSYYNTHVLKKPTKKKFK